MTENSEDIKNWMIFVPRNCWFLSDEKVYAYQKLDSKLKMLYFEALFKKKKNNLNSKLELTVWNDGKLDHFLHENIQ